MKIYLDSCDVEAIKKYKELGIIDGVTTNPSIIAKSGRNFKAVIKEICTIIDTSVSVEVNPLAIAACTPTGKEAKAALEKIPVPAKAAGPNTAANAGRNGLISFGISF